MFESTNRTRESKKIQLEATKVQSSWTHWLLKTSFPSDSLRRRELSIDWQHALVWAGDGCLIWRPWCSHKTSIQTAWGRGRLCSSRLWWKNNKTLLLGLFTQIGLSRSFPNITLCVFFYAWYLSGMLKVYSCVIDRADLFTDHTRAHITHINILKCTLEPPKLSDILLNILKVEEYSTSWCFYTHPSFLYGVRSLCRSIQQTSLSDYKCQCWKSFLPQLWRAKELSVSNVCINFHLAQPTPFDYREGTGMQNEYYTHPLDCTFGFQINVTVSAQISSCTCHVKLEMYCSLSDPWICIDTHT